MTTLFVCPPTEIPAAARAVALAGIDAAIGDDRDEVQDGPQSDEWDARDRQVGRDDDADDGRRGDVGNADGAVWKGIREGREQRDLEDERDEGQPPQPEADRGEVLEAPPEEQADDDACDDAVQDEHDPSIGSRRSAVRSGPATAGPRRGRLFRGQWPRERTFGRPVLASGPFDRPVTTWTSMTAPRARTIVEKIWDEHVVTQDEGAPAVLAVDLHLVHEVTSPQAFSGLRARGLRVRHPERTVATADHSIPTHPRNLPMADPMAAAQVDQLTRNCREFGIPLHGIGDRARASSTSSGRSSG